MKTATKRQSPLRRLAQRYARGELERGEYLAQRRKLLTELQATLPEADRPDQPHTEADNPREIRWDWLIAAVLGLTLAGLLILLLIS